MCFPHVVYRRAVCVLVFRQRKGKERNCPGLELSSNVKFRIMYGIHGWRALVIMPGEGGRTGWHRTFCCRHFEVMRGNSSSVKTSGLADEFLSSAFKILATVICLQC